MTDPPADGPDKHFWERLRRRKVAQWGLAYAALAWLALQILALVVESYDWPHTVMRAAIGIAVTGLVSTVVIAWFHGDRGTQRVGAVEVATLGLVALLGGAFVWWTIGLDSRTRPAPSSRSAAAPNSTERQPSIAVLPFENRSAGADDAFFADGMHDDILTQLSRIGALKVISGNSVERLRKTDLSSQQIGARLGVRTILEGGVQRVGEKVRISVQLIDARTDSQLWAETYDRQLSAANVFNIQSEVAESIAAALKASLTPEERARSRSLPTRNLDAWKYFQLGRQKLAERTVAGFGDSEAYFRKSIAADAGFAPAYAGLSEALTLGLGSVKRQDHPLEQARAAAEQAMRIDPALPDGWVAAALVAQNNREFAEAEGYLRRAIELEPNHAMARKFYASLLIARGSLAAGATQLETAAKLDPLSAIIQVNLGDALEAQGRLAEAESSFRRAIDLDPAYANAYSAYAGFLAQATRRYAEAEPLLRKAIELDPQDPMRQLNLADYYLDLGDTQRFAETIETARSRWPDSDDIELALAWRAMVAGDAPAIKLHAGRIHQRYPGEPEPIRYLRNVYMQEGRLQQALDLYLERHSDLVSTGTPRVTFLNSDLAIDIAVLLQKMGRTDQAHALFSAAAATLQDRPRIDKHLGFDISDVMIYAASGDRRRALTALREAQKAGWHAGWLYFRDREPALDSIRGDPEFKDVFGQIERDMERQREALAARHAT